MWEVGRPGMNHKMKEKNNKQYINAGIKLNWEAFEILNRSSPSGRVLRGKKSQPSGQKRHLECPNPPGEIPSTKHRPRYMTHRELTHISQQLP